ncbi:CARDB domain-containing protein [Hyalangium gracile]|uniref:CARDB domain-containing protein n=1 Tax=Hyalangium gracile TaxID=394092 RepID=UPI001CCEC0E7|nr:CARDB domain-containing protein [Hyalangium gracile]
MRMRRWLALALAGTLAGCYVDPYGDDFDPGFPDGPSLPDDPGDTEGADFALESLTSPSALGLSSQASLRARVCNWGDASGRVEVSFFLSKDVSLDARDTRLATSARISLTAGDCREASAPVRTVDLPEGTYFLMALADPDNLIREPAESDNFRLGNSVRVDFTAPPAPVLSWAPSTGPTQLPRLRVGSEPNVTVRVYRGGICEGTAVTASSTGPRMDSELPVDVVGNPATSYSARTFDEAGNGSACSSIAAPEGFEIDTQPPTRPLITETRWEYGTTQQTLRVKGTTEAGAEVGVFVDAMCVGTPAATVLASTAGSFSAELSFPTATAVPSRKVFVAARDAARNESECVEALAFATCAPGLADCDGNLANGCEVNLTEDESHCGTCGTSCQPQGETLGVCVAGTCGTACAVGRFDCDGNATNGCESTQACSPAVCTISRQAELAITALSVVEDPVRTAPGGAWSFGTLMRAMAGGQDPSALVRQWLRTWASPQTINGITLPARPQMLSMVLGPWESRSGGASRPLDFSKAPFRLLAIMNRMDLRNPGVQAGEGRFIFGVLDPAGNPLEFTVILEYALPGGSPEAIQRWARDWHELGQLGVSHPSYNAKLQALTDRFAKAGVVAGRPFGNALNQIRTNEVALAEPWEMREFNLTETGLRPATVKLTPELTFENSNMLSDYIRANQAAILAERHMVPERIGNVSFLGASALVPEGIFWRAPGVSTEARHKFSLNTCSGCHAGETATDFTHVSPRAAGRQAALSAYLRGGMVRDPWSLTWRSFDDLGRRATDMSALVCGTSSQQGLTGVETFGGFPAPSNLPRARVH